MKAIKCTKLFETFEEARKFMADHKEDCPKLSRADEKSKAILESNRTWKVTWYEKPYHGDSCKDYWRDQNSPESFTLAKAAALY